MDRPELDSTAAPVEILATAYRGDSAASAHLRMQLDELGIPYQFSLR